MEFLLSGMMADSEVFAENAVDFDILQWEHSDKATFMQFLESNVSSLSSYTTTGMSLVCVSWAEPSVYKLQS